MADNPYGKMPGGGSYGKIPPAASSPYGSNPAAANSQYGGAPPSAYGGLPPVDPNNPYGIAPSESPYGQAPPSAGELPRGPNGIIQDFQGTLYWKPTYSRSDSESLLQNGAEMTAILRPSSVKDCYSVSYKKGGQILHTQVETDGQEYVVVDASGAKQRFRSMEQVLTYLKVVKYDGSLSGGPAVIIDGFNYTEWDPNGPKEPPLPGELSAAATAEEHAKFMTKKNYFQLWLNNGYRIREEQRQANLDLINS